jgi:hypothetical protein
LRANNLLAELLASRQEPGAHKIEFLDSVRSRRDKNALLDDLRRPVLNEVEPVGEVYAILSDGHDRMPDHLEKLQV